MAAPAIGSARAGEPLPRFSLVLVAMFAELIVSPFLGGVPGALLCFRVTTIVVLLSALWAAGSSRTALVLYLPFLATQTAASYSSVRWIDVAAAVLHLLFLVYVFGFILTRVARARVVSIDTIAGAACAYLVIALIWADLYQVIELWHPGSFLIPAEWITGSNRDLRTALVYYSFVTMTTVGHVFDVSGPAVGNLCIAETLLGQLYLAVLISRMVGLHVTQGSKPP